MIFHSTWVKNIYAVKFILFLQFFMYCHYLTKSRIISISIFSTINEYKFSKKIGNPISHKCIFKIQIPKKICKIQQVTNVNPKYKFRIKFVNSTSHSLNSKYKFIIKFVNQVVLNTYLHS